MTTRLRDLERRRVTDTVFNRKGTIVLAFVTDDGEPELHVAWDSNPGQVVKEPIEAGRYRVDAVCTDPEAHDAHMEINGECPWCGAAA